MWQSVIKAWGNKRVDPGGYPEKEGRIERDYTVHIVFNNNQNT